MGKDKPQATDADATALNVYALAANGLGGVDWRAVPMLCAWLGIADVDGLMHRMAVIRMHRKPEGAD